MDYKDIPGWFGFQEAYDYALTHYPNGTYVEIGAWMGKSTIYLAQKLKDLNSEAKFYTVDNFLGSAEHQAELQRLDKSLLSIYQANLDACGVTGYVNTLVMSSVEAAATFKDRSVDFVFIDGSHAYEDVKADIEAWLPKIKPGGLLAGDDYSKEWHGVMEAVDELLPERSFIGSSWAYHRPLRMAKRKKTVS